MRLKTVTDVGSCVVGEEYVSRQRVFVREGHKKTEVKTTKNFFSYKSASFLTMNEKMTI
jgi:hypothetical protein